MTDNHSTAVAIVERREISHLSPALQAILDRDLPVEVVREMLALQREHQADEARRAYTRAITELKRVLPTVLAKDKLVDFESTRTGSRTTYRHTSLAAVMDAVTEPLAAHGFSLGYEPSAGGDSKGVTVKCRLTHAEGHSETCTLTAPVDTSGNKSPAQGIASTITLLQRYTAMALLGIASADMEEPSGEREAPRRDPGEVNSSRNLKAAGALKKHGKTVAEAVAHLGGKPVPEWTSADLDTLAAWVKPPADPAPAAGRDASTGVEHPDTWDAGARG